MNHGSLDIATAWFWGPSYYETLFASEIYDLYFHKPGLGGCLTELKPENPIVDIIPKYLPRTSPPPLSN